VTADPSSSSGASPRIKVVVASILIVAVVVIASVILVLPRLQQGGSSSGGAAGTPPGLGNPPASGPPPSSPVSGALIYQPGGANYSSSVALSTSALSVRASTSTAPFGILTSVDGTEYRVLLGGLFSSVNGVAAAGNFTLAASPTSGVYEISRFASNAVEHTVAPDAEVNLTSTTVGVAAANLTFGFSVGSSTPFAYLAFGTYPTFFSNVSMQGVVLNTSVLSRVLNLNAGWLTKFARSVDPNLPSSFTEVVIVNQSISLPEAVSISGQVQEVITPQNVSAFLQSMQSSTGSVDSSMVQSALNSLNEELLGLADVHVGVVQYYFVLAPTNLTRQSLTGIVSLDIETSNIGLSLPKGSNSAISTLGSHVTPVFGVTWDKAPLTSSTYQSDSVGNLWGVIGQQSVSVQAAAIGISLSDASSALSGMGYSNSTFISDLATLQNAAVFILVDPSLVQDPNLTAPYQYFALAVVPNDELSLQSSVSLYLTVTGVVYNTSYYFGTCAKSGIAGCPLLVADSVSFGHPTEYGLNSLSQLTQPTFVSTTGFLSGTTLKTVGQNLEGYGSLLAGSPVDLGMYDMGWSDGKVGFNLPTLYMTWGTGPSYEVANKNVEGLYLPLPQVSGSATGWYLDSSSSFAGDSGSPLSSGLVTALQAATSSVQRVLDSSFFNGSLPVPGVFIMMDVTTNSSSGSVLTSVSGGGTGGCVSGIFLSIGSCIIANVSLSANSASYILPEVASVTTSISGSASKSSMPTASCVWEGSYIPTACGILEMACLPGALCSIGPYHVVNVTMYTCYVDIGGTVGTCTAEPIGSSGTVAVKYSISWDGSAVATTESFDVSV
jgi:hypothetical protein